LFKLTTSLRAPEPRPLDEVGPLGTQRGWGGAGPDNT